jgi:2-oxo-4-hydroxy-4-carboxy-5-ureidoimidazoline decarboxylase
VSGKLARWNALPVTEALDEILPCCGSEAWAMEMVSKRPIVGEPALFRTADEIWHGLVESDWLEAFGRHPRIGETASEKDATARSSAWSAQEQQLAVAKEDAVRVALKSANAEYEQKFGRIFIVCATGKSASEILEIVRRRLDNDEATELRQAAEEQRLIMQIRLRKWLAE